MSMRNDGGPAFPHLNPNYDGNWDKEPQRGGMSLRDWFAGKCMAGICAHPDTWGFDVDEIAEQSYAMADAMLAARDQTP